MSRLPDDALVVRGGMNLPESFLEAPGVVLVGGKLSGISVNSAHGLSVSGLTAPDPANHDPGIPHGRVGVTTVGDVRAAGGEVTPGPTRRNRRHATVDNLTPEIASHLFTPTIRNPNRR